MLCYVMLRERESKSNRMMYRMKVRLAYKHTSTERDVCSDRQTYRQTGIQTVTHLQTTDGCSEGKVVELNRRDYNEMYVLCVVSGMH